MIKTHKEKMLEARISRLEKVLNTYVCESFNEKTIKWVIPKSIKNDPDEQVNYILDKYYAMVERKYGIDEDLYEELDLVSNDDKHAPELDEDLKQYLSSGYGELPDVILYRGCGDTEYNSIVNDRVAKLGKPLSFTEDSSAARKFGNHVIAVKFNIKLLPLYKILAGAYYAVKNSCSAEAWDLYERSVDGNEALEVLNEELEWIAPGDSVFELNEDGTFTVNNTLSKNKNKRGVSKKKTFLESQDYQIFLEFCKYFKVEPFEDTRNKMATVRLEDGQLERSVMVDFTMNKGRGTIAVQGLGAGKSVFNRMDMDDQITVKDLIDFVKSSIK